MTSVTQLLTQDIFMEGVFKISVLSYNANSFLFCLQRCLIFYKFVMVKYALTQAVGSKCQLIHL